MTHVELAGLKKSYDGKKNVIEQVNLQLQQGEFFVLVGPSGCGKSTILRMIAGLEPITDGELFVNGKRMNDAPPNKRDLSMVFQNYALYPHLNVEQNITFGLHTKKISREEQRRRCLEAAEMLGLADYLRRKPRQLSGGQRQRVALARAIVTQAPLCLMDEPLSNLDAKLRTRMRSEIRQIQRKLGITMIYVTHDQTEAMTMADRMMILHEGEAMQIGKPLNIYNHPANTFVASFIGSPAMNVMEADVSPSGIGLSPHCTLPNPMKGNVKAASKNVQVGIRPEHILFSAPEQADAVVEVVNTEVLGTETLITFILDNAKDQWIARWNGQWQFSVGDRIPIRFDLDAIHLFSKDNGRILWAANDGQPNQTAREVLR
ncbi:glycerol-3-phosphate ABC transporter ATP-binding protein [Terribacillus saccharophilus]|jgi:sn-glycerol 3-phosphate transport system ATP-binding protein|uniref:Glycerol-3-phosphate ABC transporter ATP-binding protein n=1 Tax=Terribacillus saccharophilus TaxID=361277 RepID=A0A268HF08_9BACI|nr:MULTISPECIES: ABC transporter ATP-binding protein [Terribacillus]PAE08464.1 glycerol-3-phosphate ABC transporter ATP-binding protein [Terribacillus saccharophilus]VVM33099.1 Glycerol-3-phosphate ABC transporter2C ATP-binding protein UgpC (TC 3.A.1.1.3) [Terribacillus sp. AE2B 122]